MAKIFRQLGKLAVSPLCRRLALAVFLGIIAIEAAILLPSYLKREGDLLAELERNAYRLGVAMLRENVPGGTAVDGIIGQADGARHDGHKAAHLDVERVAGHMLNSDMVRGVVIFEADGNVAVSIGEPFVLADADFGAGGTIRRRTSGGERYEVYWPRAETGLGRSFALRIDASQVGHLLLAYVARITFLVMIIALFVTAVTMAVLGYLLIFPMLDIREQLERSGGDLGLRLAVPRVNTRDEFGGLIRVINRMLERIESATAETSAIARFPFENRNPVLRFSLDGTLLYANPASREVAGLVTPRAVDPVHPDLLEAIGRAGASVSVTSVELPLGSQNYAFEAVPLAEEGYINVYGRDVTEEKQAKEALRQSNAALTRRVGTRTAMVNLFQAMTMAANEGKSLDGVLERCIDLVCGEIGWPIGHALRRVGDSLESTGIWFSGQDADARDFIEQSANCRIAAGKGLAGEVLRSGRPRWLAAPDEAAGDPRLDAAMRAGIRSGIAFPVVVGDEVVAVLEFYSQREEEVDGELLEVMRHVGTQLGRVVERSRSEEEILASRERALSLMQEAESAKELAEGANRAKSDFLATMSHELRTPLNGVLGMTDLLLRSELDEFQKDYAETIRESGNSLLSVLNDILDFSKIEAGKLSLLQEDFVPDEVIDGVAELMANVATEKGLDFAVSVSKGVPGRVIGDRGRLRQILLNLVGNAVKFTDTGAITIAVEAEPAGEGRSRLSFAISDTGIGISPAEQRTIFDRFTQADGSKSRRFNGTGLGLAIVRQLAGLMDGDVAVESAPGKGSVFRVSVVLPLARGGQAVEGIGDEGVEAVIVGGHPVARQVLGRQVRDRGAAVTLCSALSESETMVPDLLLVDMDSLDGDGDGADGDGMARLAALLAAGAIPLVVGVASRGRMVELRDAERHWDSLLPKPVCRASALRVLREALQRRETMPQANPAPAAESADAAEVPPVGAATAKKGAGLRILLAEDNPVNQKVALAMLSIGGHEVTVVENGRLAFEAVRDGAFDVVLMDIHMPEMDGVAATRAIRGLPEPASRIPVIAVTANALSGDRKKYLDAGLDDYVPKPLSPDALNAALARNVPAAAAAGRSTAA
jgi:signal transduction histidine kinase/ActR/RegA family two-component response regulator